MDKKKKVGLAVLIIIALYVAASIFFSVSLFYRNKGEWIFLCIPLVFLKQRN